MELREQFNFFLVIIQALDKLDNGLIFHPKHRNKGGLEESIVINRYLNTN